MRFICTADTHFTDKVPQNRKDDYFGAQLEKFTQILKIAEDNNADLLVAGDVFDSVKTPYKITRDILELIKQYHIHIYATFGQHDLVYHSKGLYNTPLGILSTMKQVTILNNNYPIVPKNKEELIGLIGAGWGEEPAVDEPADILITHQMIVHKDPLWPGQKEYGTAAQVMKKYPWAKVIVSGDNHLPFHVKKGKQQLINCGSLMRKGKDQINHEPVVWLIDTDDYSVEEIKLKVQPYKKVFDLSKIKREEIQEEIKNQTKEDINNFVNSLEMSDNEKPNFKNVLKKVIQEVNPDNDVKEIINNLMEEIA